jgi:adenylate cyclase
MAEERVQRRLAAILIADVVGYSRLMGEDEEGVLAALTGHLCELIAPCINEHRGRLVKTTGDGVLAEFASAVEAVACAASFQEGMAQRNADIPADKRVVFRVGVNLGDVIFQNEDVFGDGVNIAARLEALADPGGVAVSDKVYAEVRNRPEWQFEDLGLQEVKNITAPVRAFSLRRQTASGAAKGRGDQRRPGYPEKPSIAILPFANMSGDPEQEFFTDGMTEDIITGLSRFKELFVISRNTTFRFKGEQVDIQRFARDIGVQYVVEGSVRKAGDRVRITVQLIDAESDHHLWAERYDRKLEDIFSIQDDVTSSIVAILPGRVQAAAHDRAEHKPTENMVAYECVLTGKILHHRSTIEDNTEALRAIDRAIALDPKFAHAHAWKACTLGQNWTYGWCDNREETWRQVLKELQVALALDDNDSDVHRILAACHVIHGDLEKAVYHQDRALSLNPNDDLTVVQQGEILTWIGRPEEGIKWIKDAMRLNPYHPERYWSHLGRAYFVAHHYEEAIESFRRIAVLDHTHHGFMATSYAYLGDDGAAGGHVREVLNLEPAFSTARYLETMHYQHDADIVHHRDGLLKAGLPE